MIPEEAVAYIADVLHATEQEKDRAASVVYAVGEWLWSLLGDGTRDAVFDAVTSLMTRYPAGHQAYEIGFHLWVLLGGTAVSQ